MKKLTSFTKYIRSKNAGPIWITVDIFFKTNQDFLYVSKKLKNRNVSKLLKIKINKLKRFDIEDLNVIKYSFPRIHVQGSRLDRDIHGAAYAVLFEEIYI